MFEFYVPKEIRELQDRELRKLGLKPVVITMPCKMNEETGEWEEIRSPFFEGPERVMGYEDDKDYWLYTGKIKHLETTERCKTVQGIEFIRNLYSDGSFDVVWE